MKAGFKLFILLACLVNGYGCSGTQPEASLKPDFASGERVFSQYCVRCHLVPDDDAPQLDEADDWDLRPDSWANVIKEHAKQGLLGNPAKNGRSPLTAQNISDVSYFMENKINAAR